MARRIAMMRVPGAVIHSVVHARHRLARNQVVVRTVDPAGALGQLAEHRRHLDQEGQATDDGSAAQQRK